jgi:hypothetical protein
MKSVLLFHTSALLIAYTQVSGLPLPPSNSNNFLDFINSIEAIFSYFQLKSNKMEFGLGP